MLIDPKAREVLPAGKHRSSVRRHRAAHEGEYTSLLVRLVPAWTTRPNRHRPPLRRDGVSPRSAPPPPDQIAIDLRDSRQPFDQDAAGLFDATGISESGRVTTGATTPAPAPAVRPPSPEPAQPSSVPTPRLLPPTPPVSPAAPQGPEAASKGAVVEAGRPHPQPELHQPRTSTVDGSADTELCPPEQEFRLPIWDPTGEHSGRDQRPHPARRRFTFADLLGFGIETDEPVSEPLSLATAVPEAQPADRMPAADPTRDVWADFPRLSDVATSEPLRTNELVQRLWDATAEHPISQSVESVAAPTAIPEMFRANRTFRWSVVAGALMVLVAAVAGLQALGQRPVAVAEARAAQYADSLDRLAAGLTGFEATSRTILNPATPVPDLGSLTGDLLSIGSLARDVAEVAAQPLPEPSLLGASAPIDRLRSPRELLQQAAEGALGVERRLGAALTYRVLMSQAFVMPELPVAAGEGELGGIGAQLSVVQATTDQVLDQLPDDPFFATYTEAARDLAARFQEWQVAYLTALRDGDVAAAGVLRRDWQGELAAFRAGLATPLMAVDTWAGSELDHVQELIDLARRRLAPAVDGAPAG